MMDWRQEWAKRPLWMNFALLFCAYMALLYVPWDFFFKPVEEDVEVWFGVMFHGETAKWLTPLHWIVYAAGTIGFWQMSRWMWPWATIYIAQIGIGFLVWSVNHWSGSWLGWALGITSLALWAIPCVALARNRKLFGAD